MEGNSVEEIGIKSKNVFYALGGVGGFGFEQVIIAESEEEAKREFLSHFGDTSRLDLLLSLEDVENHAKEMERVRSEGGDGMEARLMSNDQNSVIAIIGSEAGDLNSMASKLSWNEREKILQRILNLFENGASTAIVSEGVVSTYESKSSKS